MTTICANCMFVKHIVQNPSAPEVWYNWFCGKAPLPATVDTTTGKKGYATKNDLRMPIVTDIGFEYTRRINDGNCKMYQKRVNFVVAEEKE